MGDEFPAHCTASDHWSPVTGHGSRVTALVRSRRNRAKGGIPVAPRERLLAVVYLPHSNASPPESRLLPLWSRPITFHFGFLSICIMPVHQVLFPLVHRNLFPGTVSKPNSYANQKKHNEQGHPVVRESSYVFTIFHHFLNPRRFRCLPLHFGRAVSAAAPYWRDLIHYVAGTRSRFRAR